MKNIFKKLNIAGFVIILLSNFFILPQNETIYSATKPQSHKDTQSKKNQYIKLSES